MSGDTKLDKQGAAETGPPLRMLGDTDVGVILQAVETLPDSAEILEIGPWLGVLTVLLAQCGHVTVVDRFLWTDANAENYPGIAAAGDNFRALFEANMARADITVDVVEAELSAFTWSGQSIDLVVIDAPRDAASLHGCLAPIASALAPGARIVVKHALNPRDLGMGAYLDALAGHGYLDIVATEQPSWCNIATAVVKPGIAAIADVTDVASFIATAPVSSAFTDPWYGWTCSVFRQAYLADLGQWPAALSRMADLPPSAENLALWDEVAASLPATDDAAIAGRRAVLSELVWIHNDVSLAGLPEVIHPAFSQRLKSYWRNNAAANWRYTGFVPELLADESAAPVISALAPSTPQIYGRSVVEVGHAAGGGALACILAGASAYLGVKIGEADTLSQELADVFQHVRMVEWASETEDDEALNAIKNADVLILHGPLKEGSIYASAVEARAKMPKDEVTVIRLSS